MEYPCTLCLVRSTCIKFCRPAIEFFSNLIVCYNCYKPPYSDFAKDSIEQLPSNVRQILVNRLENKHYLIYALSINSETEYDYKCVFEYTGRFLLTF